MFTRARWVIGIGLVASIFAGCSGSSDGSATPTAGAEATSAPTEKAQPTATAKTGTSITATSIRVSNPVARNANATASVGTSPGASCTIVYTTPSGTPSNAAGLEAKTADAKGELSWTWTIGPSTNPGEASVKVTCNGHSATAKFTIT